MNLSWGVGGVCPETGIESREQINYRDMNYIRRAKGKKAKDHIWTGEDTACRMWSTGGLKIGQKWIKEDRPLHPVCTMCRVNSGKGESFGFSETKDESVLHLKAIKNEQ